jgi:hypothetical protein
VGTLVVIEESVSGLGIFLHVVTPAAVRA